MKFGTRRLPLFLLALLPGFFSSAQTGGIRGRIVSDKGEALSYAGIFIKSTQASVSSNADGKFEIRLPPGEYLLSASCLGYLAQQQPVKVGEDWLDLEIILLPTTYTLAEVNINPGKEDRAYAIMRKAIAMAKFYKFQVQDYRAKAYSKGTAKLNNITWLARKLSEKFELDTGRVYLIETVSELYFKQPNVYTEKDLSINSSLPKGLKLRGPTGFVDGSFYDPEIDETVSPLSPDAFSYYTFKLQGSFFDGNQEIDKISVKPRLAGEDVFEGTLYLVDGLWCIKSLQLNSVQEGIHTLVTENFTEVLDKVWMPLSQMYSIFGSVYGFDFTARYQVTTSDYIIKLNPVLSAPPVVVDEKTEKNLLPRTDQPDSLLDSEKKITVKEMDKLMNQVEKEEKKKAEDPEVVSNVSWTVDSLAYKRDSLFWKTERLEPLTEAESKSCKIRDSLNSQKTIKKPVERNLLSLDFSGIQLKMDSNNSVKFTLFSYRSFSYNSVEGFVYNPEMRYVRNCKNKNQLSIRVDLRYAQAEELFTGKAGLTFRYRKKAQDGSIYAEAGKEAEQFNSQQPLSGLLNSISTFFWGYNYMKLYENGLYKIGWAQRLTDQLYLNLKTELADRTMLSNSIINAGPVSDNLQRNYTSNNPVNAELPSTSFMPNRALSSTLNLTYYLWKKYELFNGEKRELKSSSPVFFFDYRKGWKEVLSSAVDYDRIQLGLRWRYEPGLRGALDIKISAGDFINSNKLYFMDFQHFLGNQTVVQEYDEGYRMLSYYGYSTDRYFAQARVKLEPGKLLVTRFEKARLAGLKEALVLNYLYTPERKNYLELSYGIDQIFRFMKCEIVTSYADFQYQAIGIRIGIKFP